MTTDPSQPDPTRIDALDRAKADLRARVLGEIRALGAGDHAAQSHAACRAISAWAPVGSASTIMAYWPMPDEPDVRPLVRELLGRAARVCLPRVDWEARTMVPVPISDPDRDVVPGRHGVAEPRARIDPIADNLIELVVAPGVAFDATGARLGRGGGFYDRWLGAIGSHRPEAWRPPVLGVALACQVVGRVPLDEHDRRVDAIATPEGLIGPMVDGSPHSGVKED